MISIDNTVDINVDLWYADRKRSRTNETIYQ